MTATSKNLTGSRIGRFKVEELLAKGGMGEVYRGTDNLLGRQVALKTVNIQQRMSHLAKTRFFREAQILSRLSHPNICGIYDLIERDDYDLLVLEFIRGKTLRHTLKENPRDLDLLHVAEIIGLVLEVAHRAQIVHRDLKPDNVMIADDGTVKVLDFGLARPSDLTTTVPEHIEAETPSASLQPADDSVGRSDPSLSERTPGGSYGSNFASERTTHGSVVGTPRYMSPEQARGEDATSASDIYSFGIIIQEMLTGESAYKRHLPYQALLVKVGKGERRPINAIVQGQDPELIRLVDDLTRLDPEARINAPEAVRRIRRIRNKPVRRRQRRLGLLAALVFSVSLISAGLFGVWMNKPRGIIDEGDKLQAAFLPMIDQTGDAGSGWIATGLTQMVARGLGDIEGLDMVDVGNVAQVTHPLNLAFDHPISGAQLGQIAETLGSDLVIQTMVAKDPETGGYRLAYRLYRDSVELKPGEVMGESLPNVARDLVVQLSRRLNPHAQVADLSTVFSEDPYAMLIWAMGYHQLEQGYPKSALKYFEICVERDPSFIKAQYHLAASLERLGNSEEAERQCHRILELAGRNGDKTLRANCYILLGDIAKSHGDWEKTLALYEKAGELYLANEDTSGHAHYLNRLAIMYWRRDQFAEAERTLNQSLELFRSLGDRVGEFQAIQNLGLVANARGDREQAKKHYHEALAFAMLIEDDQKRADLLNNLGTLALAERDLTTAMRHFEEAFSVYRELGIRQSASYLLINLSIVAEQNYRLQKAEDLAQQALTEFADLNDAFLEGHAYQCLGMVDLKRGKRTSALAHYDQSAAIFRDLGYPSGHASSLRRISELHLEMGHLEKAAQALAQSRELDSSPHKSAYLGALIQYRRGEASQALDALERLQGEYPEIFGDEEQLVFAVIRKSVETGKPEPLPTRAELFQRVTSDINQP